MKKQIRAIIIATFITISIILGCAQAIPANAEAANPITKNVLIISNSFSK